MRFSVLWCVYRQQPTICARFVMYVVNFQVEANWFTNLIMTVFIAYSQINKIREV